MVRLTGVSKVSILKLILDLGRVCVNHDDAKLRKLYCEHIECDEMHAICYCRDKNLHKAKAPPDFAGDVWTWIAIDRRSKAILSWQIGHRDAVHAKALMNDLASRVVGQVEISTDSLASYPDAVFGAFGNRAHYGQIGKTVQIVRDEDGRKTEKISTFKRSVFGSPRLERTGTSRIERMNLTLRMSQRRWTRKTNAHSKSMDHMQASFALYSTFYNWVRPHATLKGKTPAMKLGIANRRWTMEDLAFLLEEHES